jgi:hypothetical protein
LHPPLIEYNYNSRGFRDAEWPDDLSELKDAIWVFGDSFTVGVGSPIAHTWPYAVAQELNKRVINVSMDGASNEWIARRAADVYQAVQPSKMIIMWSYFCRRESADTSCTDENRRLFASELSDNHDADIDNFRKCVNIVDLIPADCIHFVIPKADPAVEYEYNLTNTWDNIKGPSWPSLTPLTEEEYQELPDWIIEEIKTVHHCNLFFKQAHQFAKIFSSHRLCAGEHHYWGPVPELDIARDGYKDGYYFDLLSSHWVAATVGRQWGATHQRSSAVNPV